MKEEIIQNINQGLEAAYINGTLASNLEYKPSFISNSPEEGKKVISSIEEMMIVNMLSLQRRKILKLGKSPLMIEGSFICLVEIRIWFVTINLSLSRTD